MKVAKIGAAIALVMTLAAVLPVHADEVYKGTLVCAQCELRKPDAHECQDVLLVEEKGATTEYYITKNEVAEKSGEACTLKIPATVTGTVSKGKDGKLWLTPTKIEKQ
jgi:hypothetical protein